MNENVSDQPVFDEEEAIDDLPLLADVPTEHPRMPVKAQLTVLAVVLVSLFGAGATPKIAAYIQQHQGSQPAIVPEASTNASATTTENTGDEVNLIADAAFVWDVATQRVVFEKNPDEKLPLASITKLMTTLVAHELLLNSTRVNIDARAAAQEGSEFLAEGEVFNFEVLADLTLLNSSNEGAYAMASVAGALLDDSSPNQSFVRAMNIRAEELGLTQTTFHNPTGLDISSTEAGAYGSARDVAFLMEHIITEAPELVERTTEITATVHSESGEYHEAENTNVIIDSIPGVLASKTGYTALAGGNLVIAFDAAPNRPIIAVVLGSSRQGRFIDTQALVEYTRNHLN